MSNDKLAATRHPDPGPLMEWGRPPRRWPAIAATVALGVAAAAWVVAVILALMGVL